jgi:putative oxidoreductase
MKKKVLKYFGWIILVVTSLFFIMSGSQKLTGAEQMVDLFRNLGYPDWFRLAVGVVELAGAILLLIPRTILYAATALGVLMIGAVISELQLGHGFQVLLPGQWLLIFVLIVYFKARANRSVAKQKSISMKS